MQQMLTKVGTNPTALNTAEMDKQGMRKAIKGFDPANVSVKQLGNLSEMLRSRGLISEITSFTLKNAGDKFDRFGVTKDIDAKFNALGISRPSSTPFRIMASMATLTARV